ncbi:HAMP domain-containing sensor histidine kinase [Paenibacillus sp.]|jgi:signal transduction histidine kinase|uniref:HAMP domain-containing sensor histidine kinase n=1 Tax=Paenibacillus sp. TaxID=58172 RepID=UPI002833C2CC|nr:HAMP domain-containing sensor histidine kinase [Paenibacillus sp.]MDR0268243.1 HAMP domain-containing histidine kinase [Paenibacillus sp.]
MKEAARRAFMLVLIIVCLEACFPISGYAAPEPEYQPVTGWDFKWEHDSAHISKDNHGWTKITSFKHLPPRITGAKEVWYRSVVPKLQPGNSALFLKKVYGQHILIYLDEKKVYDTNRNYMYNVNQILLPLSYEDTGKTLSVQIQADKERIGIRGEVLAGDYQILLKQFVKSNLDDLILGSAIVFLGLIMLLPALFIRKSHLRSWLALTFILISAGTMILTHSPLIHGLYNDNGRFILSVYDVALLTMLPAMTFYFEKTVGPGYRLFIRHFRKFQTVYSLFCFGFMVLNLLVHDHFFDLYYFFSVNVLDVLIIVQIILLVSSSIGYVVKGSRDALIFTLGSAVFGLTVLIEMTNFLASKGKYEMFWWKWGVLGFAVALIAVLGQKFAQSRRQILIYSKELEMFNVELQRSEKVEIISELAASVAHEVRNPLQVTRGFLQLLHERSANKEKEYLTHALNELDRASGIITDFLTFAKPELDQVQLLDLAGEFRHIEGIMIPLANLHGGKILLGIQDGLYVHGNSSKFKQAFINMIKNSIEALQEDGQVHIWAYAENNEIVIHIQDNGEGMEPADIARLGEPYYSNKTKGTGLGLMVTFRIIEAMKGKIEFRSQKGVGTEAVVRFSEISCKDSQ